LLSKICFENFSKVKQVIWWLLLYDPRVNIGMYGGTTPWKYVNVPYTKKIKVVIQLGKTCSAPSLEKVIFPEL